MIARLRQNRAARAARNAAELRILDAAAEAAASELHPVRLRTNTPVFDRTVYETGTKPQPVPQLTMLERFAELDILAGPIATATLHERGARVEVTR